MTRTYINVTTAISTMTPDMWIPITDLPTCLRQQKNLLLDAIKEVADREINRKTGPFDGCSCFEDEGDDERTKNTE